MLKINFKKNLKWIAIVFVLLLLVKYGIFYQLSDIFWYSNTLFRTKKAHSLYQSRLEELKRIKADYENAKKMVSQIKENLVNKEVPINFVKFLEKEAESRGLLLEIFPGSSIKESTVFEALSLKIKVGGSFPKCLRFLERIERGKWLLEINQLIIKKVKKFEKEKFKELKSGVIFEIDLVAFSPKENVSTPKK